MQFRWIDWNRDHIAEHGVAAEEAEQVVQNAKPPLRETLPLRLLPIGLLSDGLQELAVRFLKQKFTWASELGFPNPCTERHLPLIGTTRRHKRS